VLFSTSSLIGEGVDLPELDTLVLVSPLSFEGRLIQYAGRLHRVVEGKSDVIVMDYVDSSWVVSLSMYRNRLRAYRKMGYEVEEPDHLLGSQSGMQRSLFS
jgi:superfamily II DNA or RNA helicase